MSICVLIVERVRRAMLVVPLQYGLLPAVRAGVQKLEEVYEVSGRAQHGAAGLAVAKVKRAEKVFHGRKPLDQILLCLVMLLLSPRHGIQRRCGADLRWG